MKRFISFVALFAVLVMGSSVFAQTNGLSLHLGGSLPVGSFGKTGEAFMEKHSGNGGAAKGLNLGLKLQYGIPVPILPSIRLMLTADVMYNGLQSDVKDLLEKPSKVASDVFDVSVPKYFNIPVMAGVNISHSLLGVVKVFGEVGLGVNFRMVTDMERTFSVPTLTGDTKDIQTSVNFDNARTFAFQVGLGVCLFNRISVGAHYYNLGKTELSGSLSSPEEAGALINSIVDETGKFSNGEIGTSMFMLRLGFHF